jgi:hypothetical protein
MFRRAIRALQFEALLHDERFGSLRYKRRSFFVGDIHNLMPRRALAVIEPCCRDGTSQYFG